ncbi:MAG: flavodoxin family protein [Myxococcales bacterium]|nr:flavodoxin family protein [Myxococcales bacterium]
MREAGEPPRLLGIAGSLRNARFGPGGDALLRSLAELPDEAALQAWLASECAVHLQQFLDAGRAAGLDFLQIHRNLRRAGGQRGLSNSESALAAGLWAAQQLGVAVDHLSLAEQFDGFGAPRDPDGLRARLLSADGFLLSGPVYFGDRGSLTESLFEFIERDATLRAQLAGRLFGGIAVGAKRNGGQETTLIYQMLDALRLGLLAVGNDSDTTSQYGGTGHAGDVGTMHLDRYGLETSMGVGRRMARVLLRLATPHALADRPRALFLILADADGLVAGGVEQLRAALTDVFDATALDLPKRTIRRCIACDICPTQIDVDAVYRCIIEHGRDDMKALHPLLLGHDLLIPVAVTLHAPGARQSVYQSFVERTRYLRRGDYVWSDLLVAPLLFEEVGRLSTELMRMTTSFVRHHTVLATPQLVPLLDGEALGLDAVAARLKAMAPIAARLTAGRLSAALAPSPTKYNPVGYVLAADKDREDERMARRARMVEARRQVVADAAATRLKPRE